MRLLITFILGAALAWPQIIVLTKKKAAAACGTESTKCVSSGASIDQTHNFYAFASPFTAGESATICSVKLRMKRINAATGTYKIGIYSDNAGAPGSLVGSWSADSNKADLTTSYAEYTFTGLNAALTNGTAYWIVYSGSTYDLVVAIEADLGCYGSVHIARSDNLSSWSPGTGDVAFRYTLYK